MDDCLESKVMASEADALTESYGSCLEEDAEDDVSFAAIQVYLRVRYHPDQAAERCVNVSSASCEKVLVRAGDRSFQFDRGGMRTPHRMKCTPPLENPSSTLACADTTEPPSVMGNRSRKTYTRWDHPKV